MTEMVRERKVVSEGEAEAPIHGDVLEEVFSHVPLMELVPATHVSRAWQVAVSSSLRCINSPKPWLLLHTQSTRSPYSAAAHAYDPRSHLWLQIRQPPIKHVSLLRSSHSNLLYMLSPSNLSFSFDPLHLTWHHADAPLVWRTDPIVALVAARLVVAGGVCDFEDDRQAVEIYDLESRSWDTCQSMPADLKDSAASTWLSVATDRRKLYVSEKNSGITYTLDPETKIWDGPYNLRPDPLIFYSVIAFWEDCLILTGLIGDGREGVGVKLWKVDCESFCCKEIGEMPGELVEKLKGQDLEMSSMEMCLAGNLGYIYNPSRVEEVVMCEVLGGGCKWGSVGDVVPKGWNCLERLVFSCSDVEIQDLQRAKRLQSCGLRRRLT